MAGRSIKCTIVEHTWICPTVVSVRFTASRKISFDAGQFFSLSVPSPDGGKPLKRAYSFASAPGEKIYELCVKVVPGGKGSGYLAGLKVGDVFEGTAPFGDFRFEPKPPGRNACFVGTGTGLAPLRSMVHSKEFQENAPEKALLVQGVRNQKDILYPGDFERRGVEVVNALSKPEGKWKGFTGRVTDYFRSLPADWAWETTDFYLCGNGDMVTEIRRILEGHGVKPSAIYQEVYFTLTEKVKVA